MNKSLSHQSRRRALLLSLLMLVTLLSSSALAQPAVPPTPTAKPAPLAAQRTPPPINQRIVSPDSLSRPTATDPAPPSETHATRPEPAGENASTAPILLDPAAAAQNQIKPTLQGDVKLNISVPTTIRAGEPITYTYFYTNTSGAAVSPVVEAIWPNDILNTGNPQSCKQSAPGAFCDVYPGSVVGPAVTRPNPPAPGATSVRYNIASLANNASGHFSVVLLSNVNIYPQTNYPPTRPPGSAKLYKTTTTSAVTSDDTTSTLVIGPVLVLTKAPATAGPIYAVVDTAAFTITLGNATNTGDSSGGNIRADARAATNIVVKDTFPTGSSFISATLSVGTFTTAGGVLTWSVPGPLNPGSQITLRVVYRKDDVANDCGAITNSSYNVRSKEYPPGILVPGLNTAAVGVAPTMQISSINTTPSNPVFGEQALVTIIVSNYWNQAISNVQLNYDIQTNAYFVSASSPTSTPANPSNPGGRVSWTFTMPAGSKSTASTKTFSVQIRSGFTTQTSSAATQIVIPGPTVPKACVFTRNDTVSILPRLSFIKTTDNGQGNCFIVNRGQQFTYILRFHNEGSTPINGVTITDLFPTEPGAAFTYVDGSAEIDGVAHPPTSVTNTPAAGKIIWDGIHSLSIPAKGTIDLRYKLVVQGLDFYNYHNSATPGFNTEQITNLGNNICVRINPNIQITKVGDKTTAKPGDTVHFTLRAHNYEQNAYNIGLVDFLGLFQFVKQTTGYAQPTIDTNNNRLLWQVQSVNGGGELVVEIDAKVPDICTTTNYVNEAIWQDTIGFIYPDTRVLWGVQVVCGQIHYQKAVDSGVVAVNGAETVSLRDRIVYRLSVTNAHGEALSNIQVEDQLPAGFVYVGMSPSSDLSTVPQVEPQSNGRTKLSWTIPNIAAQSTVNIRFVARAADVVVGNSDPETNANWLIVPTNAICDGACFTRSDQRIYAYKLLSVQPLITSEPSLTPNTCAQPNQIRTYKVSIVNTNNHAYASTGVTVTLPLGLKFGGVAGGTPQPSVVTTDAVGVTMVSWSGLSIAAGAPFSQKDLQMNLLIGQVWGDLHTSVQTTSPDGLIPLKDGATDVTVTVCPPSQTQGALAKEVSSTGIKVGDDIVYQISLANPTASPIVTTITDQLPANMTYVAMVEGSGPSSTSPLTWDVTVPAATGGKPGSLVLKFRVHVNSGEIGDTYPNTAVSSTPVDTTYATVSVGLRFSTYLPIITR